MHGNGDPPRLEIVRPDPQALGAAVVPDAFLPREVDHEALRRIGRELLVAIGEDPDAPGLRDTPARFARWWAEFLAGDDADLGTSFDRPGDQMVLVGPYRVFSVCEHHLLPFWVDLTVAYIPATRILGLSKLARAGRAVSSRPQVQERLVEQLAAGVAELAGTDDVAVLGRGLHLCCMMRGARMAAPMTTSALRGAFCSSAATRAEFFALADSAARLAT